MTSPNHVIENPLSGERITILERPRITGDALVWDLVLAPTAAGACTWTAAPARGSGAGGRRSSAGPPRNPGAAC